MSWQRCPICGGTGSVSAGFYNPQPYWSTTSVTRESCRACNGRGILFDPVSKFDGGMTPPWRVTSGVTFMSQSQGGFDPTRYRNSTAAVRA